MEDHEWQPGPRAGVWTSSLLLSQKLVFASLVLVRWQPIIFQDGNNESNQDLLTFFHRFDIWIVVAVLLCSSFIYYVPLTEWTPRPIQSISHNVCVPVCLCVCAFVLSPPLGDIQGLNGKRYRAHLQNKLSITALEHSKS